MGHVGQFFLFLGASLFDVYGSPRPYFLILNSSFSLILIREYHDIPYLSSIYSICQLDAGWQDSMTTSTLSFLSLRCQVNQGWFSLNIWAFFGQNTAHENSFVPSMNHFHWKNIDLYQKWASWDIYFHLGFFIFLHCHHKGFFLSIWPISKKDLSHETSFILRITHFPWTNIDL